MDSIGTFDSTKASLLGILREIQEGKVQLPDFQRGWVWDDEHVRSLLASISLSFPIGAVMMLETGNPKVRFKPRPIEGVRIANPPAPEKLILDGQQRLTSLYQALVMDEPVATRDSKKNEISRYYYIDLAKALDPSIDREEAVFGVPPDRMIKNFRAEVQLDLSTTDKECVEEALPVSLLFDIAGLTRWQMAYVRADGDRVEQRLDRWNQVLERVVQPFQQYQIPLILLGRETSKEAVCKVFEKVNTGGVSLTVFELLTATYAADDYNLRDDWAIRAQRFHDRGRVLRNVESTDFLQTIALLSTLERKRRNPAAAVGCKRKDILDLELSEYERWAETATLGYERSAKFLYEERFFAARDVPYRTQLIPLAAILAELGPRADHEGVIAKIRRWFWCGVLGELYGGTIETRFAKDLPQVLEWVGGGDEPDTIKEANFVPVRLRTLRTRQSAAYKGLHALLIRGGAQDFRSGSPIDSQLYFEERIDVHHIFPSAWCSKQNDIPAGLPDSIVNKTPLSAASNRAIGGAPPSQYLTRIQQSAGITEQRMNDILTSHFIESTALRRDDFAAFFRAREEALIDRIEEAMGKPVAGAAASSPEHGVSIEEVGVGAESVPRIPPDAQAVLIVEGDTDEQYLRLAADAAGRPELLQGIHVIACRGVNGVVQQAVLVKNRAELPLIALFDRDEMGKAGRETLLKRFDFTKYQVLTYADVFDDTPDKIEAEDLFPPKLLQRFVEEFGEENVLSEKQMHPQLRTWHYGFNAAGKEIISQFLRDNATEEDVGKWMKLLDLIRARVGLPEAPPAPHVSVRSGGAPLALPEEDSEDLDDDEVEEDEDIPGEGEEAVALPAGGSLTDLLDEIRGIAGGLGADVAEVERRRYIAFSRGRRFLVVVPQRSRLLLCLALGPDFEDASGHVRRRPGADRHPESVWAYETKISDRTQLSGITDLIRRAYGHVGEETGDRPWLRDGRDWHLNQRCHARGRQIVEALMKLIAEAAPDAEGPDWGQKHYIAWARNGRVWADVGTRPNQAVLIVRGSGRTPEDVAAELGYDLFDRQAELSDKLALGSSVTRTRDGKGLRIMVKRPRDLDEHQSAVIVDILREAWEGFPGR